MQSVTCGHPDRRHVARGLCSSCYHAWYRANRRTDQGITVRRIEINLSEDLYQALMDAAKTRLSRPRSTSAVLDAIQEYIR